MVGHHGRHALRHGAKLATGALAGQSFGANWDDAVAQFLKRRKPSGRRSRHMNRWASTDKWGERIRLTSDVLVIIGLGIMAIWFIRDVL